ncbi:hypothetical protein P3S68_023444 [Capsicum galapagoense]
MYQLKRLHMVWHHVRQVELMVYNDPELMLLTLKGPVSIMQVDSRAQDVALLPMVVVASGGGFGQGNRGNTLQACA